MRPQSAGIWWLHPAFAFGFAGVAIGIAAWEIPESMYRIYWRTPKFFDGDALRVTLFCVFVFILGSLCGTRLGRMGRPAKECDDSATFVARLTPLLFQLSFYLCILGYIIWIGLAIQRGITFSTVLGILTGEKGAMYEARYTYLPTVGGVTTLAQFGPAMMILAVNLAIRNGWRAVWRKVAIVMLLATARVLLNSERLALIELVVPALVAYLSLRYIGRDGISSRVRMLVTLAPLLGVAALFFVFTGFEYFRSWNNYYAGRDLNLWEFGAMRLLGYYVTSFNNGSYFLQRLEGLNAPYFTLHFLWGFPLTGRAMHRIFPSPLLESSEKWFYFPFLESEANLEFNNADGMLFPLMDFGVPGGLLYWFLIGIVCGAVYELFRCKRPLGIFLYPILFLSLLELPLALYWGEGRAFPSLCLLTLAPLASAFIRREYGWLVCPTPRRDTLHAS